MILPEARICHVLVTSGSLPVDDALRMQMFNGEHHLRGVEPCIVFDEQALLAEVKKEFTARKVLHHKEELALGLERAS